MTDGINNVASSQSLQNSIFLILFVFIFVDIDGKDVSDGKVYNTTENSEAHGVEEKLWIGYDVLTNEKRVDLNNENTNFSKKS